MNEEIKQILTNQLEIMRALRGSFNHSGLKEKEEFTLSLLHPESKPTIAERTHDALSDDLISENDGGREI